MSKDWVKDMYDMHERFGVHDWFEKNKNDKKLIAAYLFLRMNMIKEEFEELTEAYEKKDPEEMVDAIIDQCVFLIGTLDVFGVDAHKAWNEIWEANMAKEPGVKPGRPNPFGLPDLIKPEGWKNPSHEDNHGNIANGL